MNITISDEAREAFRDWFRQQLRAREFYNRRGDHYLVREFHKYAAEMNQDIDEASLGRYLRDDNPVIPTPDRCRALGAVLGIAPIDVMMAAGLVRKDDMDVARK